MFLVKKKNIYIITYNQYDSFSLPCFKINTMYKGMVVDKKYTLKELELDE